MRVDNNLLIALYAGMFEQPLWSTFLDQLRSQLGAHYVGIAFRPVGENRLVELFDGDHPPSDLLQLPYRSMREGRIYALEELIDPQQKGLYDALVAPWGMTQIRMVRVTEPSGVEAWLSCAARRDVGSSMGTLMTLLAPHLRNALRSFIALERERYRSAMTTEMFRRLDFGWLSLDARCRIVEAAPHMETFFQRSNVLRRGRYDRLTPLSPAVDRQLASLVKQFAHDAEARPKAINLSRDPLIDMLVSPAPDRSLSIQSPAVAIVYISGDRLSQADRCDQLVDLFGLLPSEARLAWAIAQGQSIAEAADELGLTIETARNYSKKIYAKTGSRGQAELVRNILTSVLALA